jgi:hypothetical protein
MNDTRKHTSWGHQSLGVVWDGPFVGFFLVISLPSVGCYRPTQR